jgi:hypothetical protein
MERQLIRRRFMRLIILNFVGARITRLFVIISLLVAVLMVENIWAQDLKVFGPAAIWKTTNQAYREWSDCIMGNQSSGQNRQGKFACLSRVMKKFGATDQAVGFSNLLFQKDEDGYMIDFQEKGRVDLATIFFMRANTNEVLYMVNGTPPLVSTEDHLSNIKIANNPVGRNLQKKFPNLSIWQSSFKGMKKLPDGGQRFIFAYLLKECNACEVRGQALVGYDFDSNGVFKRTELIDIK